MQPRPDHQERASSATLTEDIKIVRSCLEAAGASSVHIGIFDLEGGLRERRISVKDLGRVLGDPATFTNVLYSWDVCDQVFGSGPFGTERLQFDLSSIRKHPFDSGGMILIADYAGPLRMRSPRELLVRQVERAQLLGFGVRCALEFEFIVLDESAESLRDKAYNSLKPYAADNRCFSGFSAATHSAFLNELQECLVSADLPVKGVLSEIGPGCFEVTMADCTPVRAAENGALLRMLTKSYCRRRGLTASFMAQLDQGFPGLAGHVHLSLTDQESGAPVFGSVSEPVTDVMRHFLGGLVQLTPEFMALVCPNPNSYRRLVPGNWAPRAGTWAEHTHTVAIRTVTDSPEWTRVEYRVPGADTNPFLAAAVTLGAGLWGIEHQTAPPPAATDDGRSALAGGLRPLPHDLWEAVEQLKISAAATDLFGREFLDHYIASRLHEDLTVRKFVSAAERARYLEAS